MKEERIWLLDGVAGKEELFISIGLAQTLIITVLTLGLKPFIFIQIEKTISYISELASEPFS